MASDLGVLEGLYLIDTDSHYSEPHDLWTSRVPEQYRDLVPHVAPRPDGIKRWWLNGRDLFHAGGGSFVHKSGKKTPMHSPDITNSITWEDIHVASYDATARLAIMDQMGIYAQIVYPNTMGFAMYAVIQEVPDEIGQLIVSTYNDHIAEWQAEGKNRLLPMAVLPFWDIQASIKEAQRCHAMGLRGVTMAGNPHLAGLPDLGQPDWEPLYEVLQDLKMPINIHVGSTASTSADHYTVAWPSTNPRAVKPVNSVQIELNNSKFVSNIVVSDILFKFPDLKWVSVESGIGWIPYVLERIDYEYLETFPDVPPVDRPSAVEVFRKGVYGTFWFEHAGPHLLLDYLGADNVMWETDFPHPTCLYPSPVERSAKALAGIPRASVRKIMQNNAAKLYNIELPADAELDD